MFGHDYVAPKFLCIVALLALTAVCTEEQAPLLSNAAGASDVAHEHKCVHDEIKRKFVAASKGPQMVTFGENGEQDSLGPVVTEHTPVSEKRAMTGQSTGSVTTRNMKIAYIPNNLYDTEMFCTAVGQNRSNLDGDDMTTCEEEDIFTDKQRKEILEHIVPDALNMLSEKFKVIPNYLNIRNLTCNEYFPIHVPAWFIEHGIANTDLVLFLTAVPAGSNTVAWASECILNRAGRSIVGIINFNPRWLRYRNVYERAKYTRVAVHELMHVLGFSGWFLENVVGNKKVPILQHQTLRDKGNVTMVASTGVVREAKKHFDCDTLTGLELEDGGGSGTTGSHWDARTMLDDIMMGSVQFGNVFSSMTLALFQDMGLYDVDQSVAEKNAWGAQAGCGFFEKKCDPVDRPWFCDDNATSSCMHDYRSIGKCAIHSYPKPLPAWAQYFAGHPTWGGVGSFADYCPIVNVDFADPIACDTDAYGDRAATSPEGSYYGAGGRCFMQGDVPQCVASRCPSGNYIEFMLTGDRNWTSCPRDGTSGSVVHPHSGKTYFCPEALLACAKDNFYLFPNQVTDAPTPSPTDSRNNEVTPVPSTPDPRAPSPAKGGTDLVDNVRALRIAVVLFVISTVLFAGVAIYFYRKSAAPHRGVRHDRLMSHDYAMELAAHESAHAA